MEVSTTPTKQGTKQSSPKIRIKAYSVLIISSVLYAGNVIAGKLIAGHVPSAGLSALRGVLGLLIIVPLTWSRVKTSAKPGRKDLFQLFVLGFFGITLAYLTFIIGMQYSSGTNASIISATSPALTNTLLVLGFKAKLNKLQFLGIVTSFLGLLIVFTEGSLHHLLTLKLGLGDIILFINVSSMAIFYVLGQKIMEKLSSLVTSIYALAFGTILLVPPGVWQFTSTPWHLTLFDFLLIIYMGCFVTGFAFFLNLVGINLIGSGQATILSNLQPVLTIILSVFILGESLSSYHWVGFILVIFGIVLSLAKPEQCTKKLCSGVIPIVPTAKR
ncbi:DMT family transporter [Desulfosporosinus sp. SYSU MS00001]|uniref:DMT family transporter n=1 Tax=Desulfosporosinus sp. SYSU MS00001 TaxID=3416284 RepID=UPI003CF63981